MPRGNVGLLGSNLNTAIQQAQPNPTWLNSQQTPWQNALNLAERDRVYRGAYTNFAPDQTNYMGTGQGSTGGEGGSTGMSTQNWGAMHQPGWNGPDAYGLTNFTNGQEFGAGSEDEANAALSRIRQFDPNAQLISQSRQMGGDGGGSMNYQSLQFDQSKLPQMRNPGQVTAGVYGHDDVFNRNAVSYDPHYGITMDRRNIRPQGPGLLDILGPLAVGGFAGILGGAGGTLMSLARQVPPTLSRITGGG